MDGREEKSKRNYIKGYKLFNADFTNMYGKKFEVGKTYEVDGEISFGVDGNGFHFCEHFVDTFRYFDTAEGFVLAEVIGTGEIVDYFDDYYGYYDMHASSKIEIVRVVSREEILNMVKKLIKSPYGIFELKKFFSTFALTEEEKKELLTDTHPDHKIVYELLNPDYNNNWWTPENIVRKSSKNGEKNRRYFLKISFYF